MEVKEIYLKTMKFIWLKLALGIGLVFCSIIWLAICFGLAALFGGGSAFFFAFWFWIGGTAVLNSIIMHYFGYLIKAGHIAIITEAVKTGQIPENQFEVATAMVKERFVTSNVYFIIDKLISGSVKQVQGGLDTVDHILGNIPGVSVLVSISKVFVGISLGYVDECCLGYTFYNKEDSAFKSAADGVVIYFQNWKTIFKNALGTTLVVIVSTFLLTLLPFLLFGAIFAALHLSAWLAFFLALFVAISFKSAFIDSYVLIKTMTTYMSVAPETQITFDLYGKLCKLSRKFKELFEKANVTISNQISEPTPVMQPVMQSVNSNGQYCSQCGSFNSSDSVFCGSCGNSMTVPTNENVIL